MKHAQCGRSHAHTRPKEHSPRCLFPLLAEIRLIPGASAGLKIALAIVTARAARGGQTRALLRYPSRQHHLHHLPCLSAGTSGAAEAVAEAAIAVVAAADAVGTAASRTVQRRKTFST